MIAMIIAAGAAFVVWFLWRRFGRPPLISIEAIVGVAFLWLAVALIALGVRVVSAFPKWLVWSLLIVVVLRWLTMKLFGDQAKVIGTIIGVTIAAALQIGAVKGVFLGWWNTITGSVPTLGPSNTTTKVLVFTVVVGVLVMWVGKKEIGKKMIAVAAIIGLLVIFFPSVPIIGSHSSVPAPSASTPIDSTRTDSARTALNLDTLRSKIPVYYQKGKEGLVTGVHVITGEVVDISQKLYYGASRDSISYTEPTTEWTPVRVAGNGDCFHVSYPHGGRIEFQINETGSQGAYGITPAGKVTRNYSPAYIHAFSNETSSITIFARTPDKGVEVAFYLTPNKPCPHKDIKQQLREANPGVSGFLNKWGPHNIQR